MLPLALFLLSARVSHTPLAGRYSFSYVPCTRSGWDIDLRQLEEVMELYTDSTYTTTRIWPQGGFTCLPRRGHWKIKNKRLWLVEENRLFIIGANGLTEPQCSRKELRKIPWVKRKD